MIHFNFNFSFNFPYYLRSLYSSARQGCRYIGRWCDLLNSSTSRFWGLVVIKWPLFLFFSFVVWTPILKKRKRGQFTLLQAISSQRSGQHSSTVQWCSKHRSRLHYDSSSDGVLQHPYPILFNPILFNPTLSDLFIILEEMMVLESIIITNKSYHVYIG